MMRQKERRVIVALGVGRSGTSLLMQVLHKLGMDVSEIMTPPSEQNHLGGYEDTDIFTTHNEILRLLQTNQLLPLPDNWLLNPGLNGIKPKLSRIVEENIQKSQKIWGFKDPRTVLFLPLWFQIFNALKIVPINICAVRAPGATIRSLEMQYNQNNEISELFWLNKTCAALSHTGGNCHIVHYEDWFTRPVEQAQSLLKFTGLDQYFTNDVKEVLSDVIKPNLNRAIYDEYEVKNKFVLKLYDAIQNCRGDDYDHARLMLVVKECRRAMADFKGWYLEAQRYLRQQSKFHEQFERERRNSEELAIILDNERRKVTELTSVQVNERRNSEELAIILDKERKELKRVKNFFSYRLGKILVKAVKKPGWKTVSLPYDVIKLVLSALTERKNKQPYIKQNFHTASQRTRQSEIELESALRKKISLTNEYAMAETRIDELMKTFEASSNSETDSSELTEAVLNANKLLLELKDTEDAALELRIRCQAGSIRH